MKIIKILILFIIASLFVIPEVTAVPITKFGAVTTNAVGNGNGYYDNELAFTNVSTNRNIYVVTEPDVIYIVEPLGYPLGISGAVNLVQKGNSNLIYGFVASDGYLYFTDSDGIKRKKTRSDNTPVIANDTVIGGSVLLIVSGTITKLYEFENNIYYFDGTNLKYIAYPDYTPTTAMAGVTQGQDFSIYRIASEFNVFVAKSGASGTHFPQFNLYQSNATTKNTAVFTDNKGFNSGSSTTTSFSTIFTTSSYIYLKYYDDSTGGGNPAFIEASEKVLYKGNLSVASTNAYNSINTSWASRTVSLGGYSTFAMYSKTSSTYDVFSFVEVGTLLASTTPSQLTYDTKTISSLDSQYYNKSTIYLEYNVIINSLNVNNLLLDFNDYRWMISMTDPNGVTTDIVQSPKCSFSSILDTTCQVTSQMGITAPPAGWLQGSWTAKLYEINIVDTNRALIATSTAFTVLNTTVENQSVVPPPFIPPTSGTAPQAISLIDGFVNWLGMGVNSVSKLLFAMIFIAIAATVGLIWGNGNIAMVFAFVPYAFFTFIDYIPKWIFIITIILIAITSKAFR